MTIYNDRPLHIAFLLIKDFALMSFSAVTEPLRAANLIADQQLYSISYLSVDDCPAISSSGVIVNPTLTLDEVKDLDFLFVVAGSGCTGFRDNRIFKWLQKLDKQGVNIGGVSAGPFLLSLAGIMKRRRLTVHWEHAAALIEEMPGLMLERSRYVIDRDRYTCAGGIAALDMMNAFLTERHGFEFAQKISDWFLHTEIPTSSSPQRAGLSERYPTATRPMILAIETMNNHLADPLDLKQLALLSGITPRQLNRLFAEYMGQSTMDFYKTLRLQTARKLLQQSSLKIVEVAEATGFVSAAHFSSSFNKLFGMKPSGMRKQKVS
jgi:transcriptional regulator GlxA family with amidase domain